MMRVRVKICGVTTAEAAGSAAACGADAVGFVFYDGSPRSLDARRASALARDLPPFVTPVAVFHHPRPVDVEEVLAALRRCVVQAEPAEAIVRLLDGKAVLLPVFHDGADLSRQIGALAARGLAIGTVLLEASGRGGRGAVPDWARAESLARERRLVLAGGLTPENVADAIRRVRPWGVDVSSGVESAPGVKDPERIARFLAAVRRAEDDP